MSDRKRRGVTRSRTGAEPDAGERDEDEEKDGEDGGSTDLKSYRRILREEIGAGLLELRRPARGLFLSGLSAGLDIGFSVLLMAAIATMARGRLPDPVVDLMLGNAYALGFIFVILGRSELFTEHTTLAALPVLDRQASVLRLLRLWGIVYVSNVLGATLFAVFVGLVGPRLGTASAESFGALAERLVARGGWIVFPSAILAGWMMGLLSWLVTASKETISKVFVVWLVTSAIGLTGLHHSIVGTVEAAAGLVVGRGIAFGEALLFLALATLGNAVGGFFFVALIKYGHATQPAGGDDS